MFVCVCAYVQYHFFVVFECFISVLYGLVLLLCCISRVTDKKHTEAVLMSRIYPDAHGRGRERGVQRLTEVVQDACGIRNEGAGICRYYHCMSDSLLAFCWKIAPVRN